jgi:hypothetical protein
MHMEVPQSNRKRIVREVHFSLVVYSVTIGSDAMVRAEGYSMFDREGKVGVRTTALGIVVGRRLYGLRSMCE